MSGPATAAFSFAPLGAVYLAAMALREAREMGREYQDVLADMQSRADGLACAQRESRKAQFAQLAATRQQCAHLETQLARLQRMASSMGLAEGGAPEQVALLVGAGPSGANPQAWQEHLQALAVSVAELKRAIASVPVAAAHSLQDAAPDNNRSALDDALHVYMAQRRLHAQLDDQHAEPIRLMVARLLGRLELDDGESVPSDLDALGQSIALSPTLERAEALSLELRLRIQHHGEQRAAQRADAAQASAWLETLGDDTPDALRALLDDVLAGQHLSPQTRALSVDTLAAVADMRKKLEEEAAAQVLEQSLRDLGYAVDGVENTFFVEGGMAHFQRQGWGEYFVRVRVGVQDKTLNFNVVRAKGAQETAERKRLDYLAEDRWCSEFPKLLETLAARGIQLDVKRLLGAGELPVQAVDPATVPSAQTEYSQHSRDKLREMKP
ncbi:MAG: hypothetical protein ABIZ09_13465 [Rhodoferax sp.]